MPKKSLTALALPSLPAGEYWDTVSSGLVFRVGTKRRSWAVRHWVNGANRRDPLGIFPTMGLAEARKAAAGVLERARAGLPPPTPVPHPTSAGILTLGTLLDRYEAMREKEGRRIKTLPKAMATLRRELKAHLKLPAVSLSKADIRAVRDDIQTRGADAAAAGFLRVLGPVLKWAATEDLIDVNPAPLVRKPMVVSRERVLSDSELKAIWEATSTRDSFARLARFLMLTAQRRDEAASLTFGGIVGYVWRQTENKSSRPHAVVLLPMARVVVGEGADADLVFPGRYGGKFSGFSKAKRELDEACGVTNWRLHDLRRTAATRLEELGISVNVVEAILNHRVPGVGGVYRRSDLEAEKRKAMRVWETELRRIIGTNVETLTIAARESR